MGNESFSKELWERRAAEERNERKETPEDRAVAILETIHAAGNASPELAEFVEDLEEQIFRHEERIADFSHAKIEEWPREDFAAIDESRRIAHNALIDKLNITARIMSLKGVDSSWRNKIGLDRDAVSEWAHCAATALLRRQHAKRQKEEAA